MASSFSCLLSFIVGLKFCIILLMFLPEVHSSPWWGWPFGCQTATYKKCPQAFYIINQVVVEEVNNRFRTAAELARLHFHDCFVNGCDGSVLLNEKGKPSELSQPQNANSIRGMDVIEKIKKKLEEQCPGVVSCADIIAIAARDSIVAAQGPCYSAEIGRRDSKFAYPNSTTEIPGPTSTLSQLIRSFKAKNLTPTDMVALSGAHTIGFANCKLVANIENSDCPNQDNITALDIYTPKEFDINYFLTVTGGNGRMPSDQAIYNASDNSRESILSRIRVQYYAKSKDAFYKDFSSAMIAMGRISSPKNSPKVVRKTCSKSS